MDAEHPTAQHPTGEHPTGEHPAPEHPAPEHPAIERATALLRARGDRMTGPRRAVLAALAAQHEHLTADQVVTAVAERDPGVHRASVYRTLETLSGLGVVQHVHVGHGTTTYHLAGEQTHLHAQCGRCGAVIDLPATLLDDVAAVVRSQHGFQLDPSHVALSGTCARCLAERGTDGPTTRPADHTRPDHDDHDEHDESSPGDHR